MSEERPETPPGQTTQESMERKYLGFIQERIQKNGSISLQNLTGHLSQLPTHMRDYFGTSKASLKKFLSLHPGIFYVDKKDNVWQALPRSSEEKPPPPPPPQQEESQQHSNAKGDGPGSLANHDHLVEVKGKIYRLFPRYGFISIVEPIKASVYFDCLSFEDGSRATFQEWDLNTGQCVLLNAKRGPEGCEAQYRASRVWRPDSTQHSSSSTTEGPPQSARQRFSSSAPQDRERDRDRDRSLHVTATGEIVRGTGVVQTMFDRYGFIKQSTSVHDNVFFHINNVASPSGEPFGRLEEVMSVGERVTFDAVPTVQKDAIAKWQAKRVWIGRFRQNQEAYPENDVDGEEVYLSGSETGDLPEGESPANLDWGDTVEDTWGDVVEENWGDVVEERDKAASFQKNGELPSTAEEDAEGSHYSFSSSGIGKSVSPTLPANKQNSPGLKHTMLLDHAVLGLKITGTPPVASNIDKIPRPTGPPSASILPSVSAVVEDKRPPRMLPPPIHATRETGTSFPPGLALNKGAGVPFSVGGSTSMPTMVPSHGERQFGGPALDDATVERLSSMISNRLALELRPTLLKLEEEIAILRRVVLGSQGRCLQCLAVTGDGRLATDPALTGKLSAVSNSNTRL